MRSVVILLLVLPFIWGEYARKHLAGPPDEFKDFALPLPQEAALEESSALLEVRLQGVSGALNWKGVLSVDSSDFFSFNIFSPIEKSLKLSLYDPHGQVIDLEHFKRQTAETSFPIGLKHVPGTNYYFPSPYHTGEWTIEISSSSSFLAPSNEPHALIILYNHSPITQHSYLSSYNLELGSEIGLVTRMVNTLVEGNQPLKDVIADAIMEVYDPSGKEITVQMHDDGLHGDEGANDGIYGAFILPSAKGTYRAQALLKGKHTDGTPFIRSTQHLIPIVERSLTLTGKAKGVSKDENHLDIQLEVSSSDNSLKYRGYTELWGTSKDGRDAAVCWLSGIVNAEKVEGNQIISFELDLNWIKRAGVQGPFTLKNVLIQDAQYHVPVAQASQISVSIPSSLVPVTSGPMSIPITQEMRQGVPPKTMRVNATSNAPTLMLVHGYCAGTNPWNSEKNDFQNAAYFLEPDATLTNQQFAELILKHADELGMTHWSGIGHSQGGHALTHILNYYHSGLSLSTGGRRVQTVGTPWKGCSAAGCAADIGAIFGFGCGSNFDLSMDGANLWLCGITPETKSQLFYYTTTYKQGNWLGDWCNIAINLVLKWPNDGTSEFALSSLRGANNMGNKEEWCHTTDMAYTAQYQDHQRNIEMNNAAAR